MSQLALENLTFSYLESGKVKTLEGVTFTADSSDITVPVSYTHLRLM